VEPSPELTTPWPPAPVSPAPWPALVAAVVASEPEWSPVEPVAIGWGDEPEEDAAIDPVGDVDRAIAPAFGQGWEPPVAAEGSSIPFAGVNDRMAASVSPFEPSQGAALDQPTALASVRAYEAAALAALAETVRLISQPSGEPPALTLPGPTVLAAALTELEAAEASAAIVVAVAAERRSRLLALNEVLPRLRALLELRDRGYLSTAEVERKRAAILAPLTDLLFEAGGVR
jgi:hypothetical protein